MDAVRTHGPDATIAQMAEAAGVSKPVLFAEFGDKLGVADAVAVVLADRVERDVLSTLAAAPEFNVHSAIGAIVEGLVSLVVSEPELYGFLARSIRSSDRGFLDNALVRVVHERALLLVGTAAAGAKRREVEVLTDGVFGFAFAAIESWQSGRKLSRARLVELLSGVLYDGLVGMAARLA